MTKLNLKEKDLNSIKELIMKEELDRSYLITDINGNNLLDSKNELKH